MRRREFIRLFAGAAAAFPNAMLAQQPDRIRRIGLLMPFDAQDVFGREIAAALRRGLQQLGWIDGGNLDIEERWIAGNETRRAAYAAELVRNAPDVIFACFAGQLAALSQETRTIPIVFVGVSDPVAAGYVESFAHPGSNITGFVFFEPSMVGKWLGALMEIAPALARIGFLVNPGTSPHYQPYLAAFEKAADTFRVKPVTLIVREVRDVEVAIAAFARQVEGGLLVAPDTFTAVNRELIAELAQQYRVPAVYVFRPAAIAGGLISYGPDQIDVVRRSASYVDRILRGENPSGLPVQAPTKFELVINLKTAKVLGLTVPPSLLGRADEVIE